MIPPLDSRGLLPPGRYIAELSAVEAAFCYNPWRKSLWAKFNDFLALYRDSFPEIEYPLALSGSFFTDKNEPDDIDCAVLIARDISPLDGWNLGMWSGDNRENFKREFRVDFWPSFPWGNDFSAFWAYVGPKTAEIKKLNEKDLRGIVVVKR